MYVESKHEARYVTCGPREVAGEGDLSIPKVDARKSALSLLAWPARLPAGLYVEMQNPQLSANQPVAMANEFFVLSRGGVSFSAKAGRQAKVEGSGSIYLSTLRMVFVSDRASGSSFDIPLATLYTEKFNQPIFGANNLTGTSPPLDLPPERDHYTWCIKFNNGGVGTFLPFFFRLLQEMRMRMQQAPQAAAAPVAQVSRERTASHAPLQLSCLHMRSRLSGCCDVARAGGAGAAGHRAGPRPGRLRRPQRSHAILRRRASSECGSGGDARRPVRLTTGARRRRDG